MKTLFTTLSLLFTLCLFAQEEIAPTPEASITSLQANLGTIHLVHERKISSKSTVRLEIGARQRFRYSSPEVSPNYYGLQPVFGLSGRHYYNLAKRAERGQNTANNSGNFVGLTAQYRPDFFLYNTNSSITTNDHFSANAHWGLRRQLGRRFDFELTAGVNLRPGSRLVGRRSILGTSRPSINWRIGYRF
ncbi:hypothetical protein FUA23_01395 [Neolewinella aurantiaca]|uniref:DUF3575 domain-containing protein n=1 Tax=Neolewinella aurantiaca TaxID=2602767 RepID=A0A5C7G010_9BACT|nr:hypothetical protein [Neolewinella aurantiaca]TXF91380.1 hypothetical protein FUA23_01395 [Neolewinella aurantiaca]